MNMDLTRVFASFEKTVGPFCSSEQEPNPQEQLAFANSRARLRMMTLYAVAQSHNGIVVGTGNRVEDFGVGFFTKYGDGGVDISPIGDCYKTHVWDMGDVQLTMHRVQNSDCPAFCFVVLAFVSQWSATRLAHTMCSLPNCQCRH